MVNITAKDPVGPTTERSKRSTSLEATPHRPRKRSLSTMLTTTGTLGQSPSKEETEAHRHLTRPSQSSKPTSSTRQSESARLLKLVPDLNAKEVSRLVAALVKGQKRDAISSGKRRDKTSMRSVPAIFPEKQVPRKQMPAEVTDSQVHKVPMPARVAAMSRQDALRMLRDAEPQPQPEMSSTPLPLSTIEKLKHHQDLAEELVH